MITDEEFRQGIASFIKRVSPVGSTMLAKVQSVDETAFTCTLIDDDENATPHENIRLRPVLDGNESLTIFPTIGTWALAIRIEDGEEWMIMAVGQAAKYRIVIGNSSLEITSDGVVFNGGSLGGMVKVASLVAKINALESDLNTLKTAFNSWVIVPSDGGAALKTIAATWSDNVITETVQADIENTKVKQ